MLVAATTLDQALLAGGHRSFHVAVQYAFERLGLLPFGMLGGHLSDAVDGEVDLRVHGIFEPEGAVVVEGGDAVSDRNEVGAAFFGDALDEGDDVFLGGGVVPGGKGVRLGLPCRLHMVLILASGRSQQQNEGDQEADSKMKLPGGPATGLNL